MLQRISCVDANRAATGDWDPGRLYARAWPPRACGRIPLTHAEGVPAPCPLAFETPGTLAAASATPATPSPATSAVTGDPRAVAAATALKELPDSAPFLCSSSTSELSCGVEQGLPCQQSRSRSRIWWEGKLKADVRDQPAVPAGWRTRPRDVELCASAGASERVHFDCQCTRGSNESGQGSPVGRRL